MTDLSRERVVERIGNALAMNDGSDDLAEAVYKAIQPLLSNVLWWRDQARRERDQALGRIGKARALPLIDIECERHGSVCYANKECPESGKMVDAQQLWAVLDGEREPVLSTQPGSGISVDADFDLGLAEWEQELLEQQAREERADG